VPHPLEDVARCPIAPRRMALIDHTVLAAAVADDPQEPTREGGERLAQRFGGRRQRVPLGGLAGRSFGGAGRHCGGWPLRVPARPLQWLIHSRLRATHCSVAVSLYCTTV
jgi:hypothetical protein